jgi:L-seryl-tRNA(Ser) seleniumtransferase
MQGTSSRAVIIDKNDGESFPLLEIALDETALGRSAFEVCRRLRRGTPPIYVGHGRLGQGKLLIHPMHLNDAATAILARRLREELSGA